MDADIGTGGQTYYQHAVNVISPAEVAPYAFGGWGVHFWVGQAFDEEANSVLCRAATDDLVAILNRHGPVALILPLPRQLEIVVEAPLRWCDVTYDFGFNTSDGAVSIGHSDREPLDRLLGAVAGSLILLS